MRLLQLGRIEVAKLLGSGTDWICFFLMLEFIAGMTCIEGYWQTFANELESYARRLYHIRRFAVDFIWKNTSA